MVEAPLVPRTPLRRLALIGALFVGSLLSCGREITGPEQGVLPRYAHGLSFVTEFPAQLASVEAGAGAVIPFTRVRVLFRRADGSVALDRMVDFPSGQDEVALSLSVPLSATAPAAGEPLQLFLRYINAAGDTVFSGGPVDLVAVPSARGDTPPAPVNVPVAYTGPGAEATTVSVAPDTLWINAGQPFAFTASAADASAAAVPDAPLIWSVLDATKLSLTNVAAGAGTSLPSRGAARVRVALAAGGSASGWADTAIVMLAPVPSALTLLSGAGQTAAVTSLLGDSIVVRLTATDGLALEGHSVTFAVTGGGGSVSPTSVVTDADGRAAAAWTLGGAVGAQSLSATVTGLTPVTVQATGEATVPTKLAVTTQPGAAYTAGDTLAPIVVEVQTAASIVSPLYTDSVRIAVASGPAGGQLIGRRARVPVNGVVTFDSLSLTIAGSYTFEISATGLIATSTSTVTVTSAAPDSVVLLSGGGQIAAPGTPLPQPVVVRIQDAFGNAAISRLVEAEVLTSGGSVAPEATFTDANGHASFTWTLANVAGAQGLRITVPSSTVAPLDVAANDGVGPIVATIVAPAADTLTFVGATRSFSASSRDAALTTIAGSYTWSSLDDSIATVDASGVVTAVKNGTARIVATEAGGSADTATVLVAQEVSSVTITPGSREIYLGAAFTFTAQAVDGGGTPLAVQPTVSWSVQNEAIATVDGVGTVSGTGLGSTQLRALMAGVQGVAGLTIKTPITRIAVQRDSIGFVQTDTFTIVALQRTRSYRAVAYDTLDVPMSGVTFVFESTNPSVAAADSTGSATLRVKALANGLTSIRATAQGVAGTASLRVQQVLADLDLTPKTVNVAPSGAQLVTARGLDADGFFLPSVSGVAFTSLQPAIATVNATTGLVTGVSAGTALVTAFKDTIFADTITVTVGEGVPAVISFGRDSLAIGRSGSQSVPIYLSKPSATPVTVLLAVADTFAYFSQASVTISAGATSANATLNGRNAGLTSIRATDGSAVPTYAGDTALLAVQANVRFTTTSYSLVTSNSLSTQILLSDPAPAGGAYVSYQFGTPGRVEISPDPAFIPAGQLAANVVFTALAGGSTTVTPVTTGATGQTATVTTYPATLDVSGSLYRLGLGQQRTDIYVQAQNNLTQPLTVSISSSDTSVVKVPATATINAGTYYDYFWMNAAGPNKGQAYIRVSAPGWTTDSVLVQVNSPRVGVCCSNGIQTTSPATGFSVSARDSLGSQYPRIAPLVVTLESSDTSIIKLSTTTATIPAGSGSTSTGLSYTPNGGVGTARIRVSAPGHAMDSVPITVTGPKLSFSGFTYRTGRGQSYSSIYVQVPNNTTAPLLVTLTAKQGGITGIPDTVTIPTGTYYRYFTFTGLTTGADTIYASAPGHQPDTAVIIVSSPRLGMTNLGIVDNFRPPFAISVSTRDSLGTQYPVVDSLPITLTSSDTSVVKVTPSAYVLPGNGNTSTPVLTVVGEGRAQITATAPGYAPISDSVTVRTPKLSISSSSYRLGRRQFSGTTSFYLSVPNDVADTLKISVTRSNPSVDSITSAIDIPPGTYYRYFGLAGLELGADTMIFSAPGYLPDTMVVVVTSPRLLVGTISTPLTTTTPPRTFGVTTADSVGTAHASMDTVVISVASSNSAVLQVTQPSYRILPGTQSVSPQVSFVGPGTAFITVADSAGSGYSGGQTNTVTVTGPSLSLSNNTPKLGMRQHNGNTGAYVSVPNNIVGAPLTVYLTSSDPSAVSVPASVEIPVGTYYAYFRVTAHDAVATVQITATAVGYSSANMNQQVTAPRFVINAPTSMRATQSPGTITVYATDADGTQHPTTENVVVVLASSDAGVASIDSATVTILANTSSNNRARVRPHAVGTIQLSVTDPRSDAWRYGTATSNLAVTTPNLTLDWATLSLGVGQYANGTVSTSDNQRPPVLVTLTRKTSTTVAPDTVTVDSATFSRAFRITGASVGLDSIKATGAGHNPDSAAVSVGLGRIDGILSWPTTMSTDTVLVTLRTKSPDGTVRNVAAATTFTLGVDANLKFVVGGVEVTSVTVPADASQVQFRLVRVSAGVANVSISNANYTAYNSAITVNAP